MVLELAGGEVPGKGAVVRELVRSARVSGCFYAGDDVADLEAFRALDELDAVASVRVAVRSEETPERLIAAADLIVDRPAGLVRLLSEL
jgi:trehalose 6-phosphate phosphatase